MGRLSSLPRAAARAARLGLAQASAPARGMHCVARPAAMAPAAAPQRALARRWASSSVFDATEADFKAQVVESPVPVVVDFHAAWCGPCKVLGPMLEQLVTATDGKVRMAKVDIDENGGLAQEHQVTAVPFVVGYHNGKQVTQFVGADPSKAEALVKELEGLSA